MYAPTVGKIASFANPFKATFLNPSSDDQRARGENALSVPERDAAGSISRSFITLFTETRSSQTKFSFNFLDDVFSGCPHALRRPFPADTLAIAFFAGLVKRS